MNGWWGDEAGKGRRQGRGDIAGEKKKKEGVRGDRKEEGYSMTKEMAFSA